MICRTGRSALALLALAATGGCLGLGREETTTAIREDGAVTRVEIELDVGDVAITGAPSASEATGSITTRWSDVAPEVLHYVEDGVLHVIGRCDTSAIVCMTEVEVQVPAGAAVGVRTGRGSVETTGITGDVEVASEDGDLAFSGISGTLVAETGNGSIAGEGLATTFADTRTDRGDVALQLTLVPDRVVARSGKGDLLISVPAGTYRVEADAPSGDVSVAPAVVHDPTASSVIVARTDRGDVRIDTRGKEQSTPRKSRQR